jgi:isochorismate synthase
MIQSHSSTIDLDLKPYSSQEIISCWFRLACKNGMSVALWKLPGDDRKHLVVDTRESIPPSKVDLEEVTGGFLVAPFHNPERSREILIKSDLYFSTERNKITLAESLSAKGHDNLLDQFLEELKNGAQKPEFYFNSHTPNSTTQYDYQHIVEKALERIQRSEFQKVVPAAIRQLSLQEDFSCLDTFDKLCDSYPAAFVSLVSTPEIGTWMGASPETIIEVKGSKYFTTVAVAGTQAYHPGTSLQEVAWRQKEIEEQALVSRYIINCFKKIRLREFEEVGPKTVVAGNLLHLKTTYTVDMEETQFPLLGSVMLDLLHPTSAVCGMPKTPAAAFLNQFEAFDRALFSGYLGPVNINNGTHLYVNLRCMQIQAAKALLYAGAGITEDSVPEREWMETQLKCDTLLEVMKK